MTAKTGAFHFQPPIDAVLTDLGLHGHGGSEGGATPHDAGVADFVRRDRDLEDYLPEFCVFTGNLIGGTASFPHGLQRVSNRVLICTGFWDAGGHIAKPLTLNQVDDTGILMGGGGGAAAYRITLILTHEPTGW